MQKKQGSQIPTNRWCAEYSDTDGDIAGELIAAYGYELLPWQQALCNDILAKDEKRQYLNMIIGMCIPRQNGKTLLIVALCIYFLTAVVEALGVRTFNILYSAHEVRTARDTFMELKSFFSDKETYPELYHLCNDGKGIRSANGQESIECQWTKDGKTYRTKIEFCARSKRAARGLSKDVIIFDEAQELTSEQVAAMLPTLAAAKTRQMLIYLGTPNYPGCPGDRFKEIRKDALTQKPKGVCWWEYSTDEIGDIRDKDRWYATNPSLGYLITEEYIETVEMTGMSEDDFARERLGMWLDDEKLLDLPINKTDWFRCENKKPEKKGIKSFGVKFDILGRNASVSVCLKNKTDYHIELVEVFDCSNGMNNLVEYLKIAGKKAAQIIIDGRGTSYDLYQRLLNESVPKSAIIVAKTTDLQNACSMLASAVVANEITHYGQDQLTDAATTCTRRVINKDGAWGFEDSNNGFAFIVESAALAYYASRNSKRNPNRKGRIG